MICLRHKLQTASLRGSRMATRKGWHSKLPMNVRVKTTPTFDFNNYIEKRDYIGALAFIEAGHGDWCSSVDRLLWIAYCSVRLQDYERAKEAYLELLTSKYEDVPKETRLYLSIVYFYMQSYAEAEETASLVPNDSQLKNRILLHVARSNYDETKVAKYRQQLHDSKEDKLSAAALDFSFRHRYQETADLFKRMLDDDKNALALNVYLAMCYFKMDDYDLSLEVLSIYSEAYPNSTFAANVKACNVFRLYNGKAALEILESHCDERTMIENELIRHNVVVFKEGEKALQVLPRLVHHIPEARLNLAIYFLKHGEIEAASELMQGNESDSTQAHIVLGNLNAQLAQLYRDDNILAKAQSHFHNVGNSSTECDTIPGRQCMASYLYLQRKFDDVMLYLDSIKPYLNDNDDFRWNYGISMAACGKYADGLEALLEVSNESYKSELAYILWLAKCYIMTDRTENAWGLFDMENDSYHFKLLQLIANECYKLGERQFLYSAKSFYELFKIDAFPDYLNGLIGSSIGYFRYLLATRQESKLRKEDLKELVQVSNLLESSSSTKCHNIAQTIHHWMNKNITPL